MNISPGPAALQLPAHFGGALAEIAAPQRAPPATSRGPTARAADPGGAQGRGAAAPMSARPSRGSGPRGELH